MTIKSFINLSFWIVSLSFEYITLCICSFFRAKRRSDQSASEAEAKPSKHQGRTKKVNPPNKPKTKASRKKPSTKVDVEINQPKARLSDRYGHEKDTH